MKIVYLYNWKNGVKSSLPSDTLWGNLCWGFLYLYGESTLLDFLKSYEGEKPNLIMSSAFPYYITQNQEVKLFFPKPCYPLNEQNLEVESNEDKIQKMVERKKLKKIQWVEYSLWKQLIQDQYREEDFKNTIQAPKLFSSSITRNTIDRINGGTLQKGKHGQLFVEDYYLLELQNPPETELQEIGLFFLCQDHTEGKLEAVLRLLSHWGIGGNKSIGKGIFEFRMEDFEIFEPQNANAMMNLSLYYPLQEELKFYKNHSKLFQYQLEIRKGYYGELIDGKYQKQPLFYFKEGSIFPLLPKDYYGQNVIELNRVHRYGMPLMLKFFVN